MLLILQKILTSFNFFFLGKVGASLFSPTCLLRYFLCSSLFFLAKLSSRWNQCDNFMIFFVSFFKLIQCFLHRTFFVLVFLDVLFFRFFFSLSKGKSLPCDNSFQLIIEQPFFQTFVKIFLLLNFFRFVSLRNLWGGFISLSFKLGLTCNWRAAAAADFLFEFKN